MKTYPEVRGRLSQLGQRCAASSAVLCISHVTSTDPMSDHNKMWDVFVCWNDHKLCALQVVDFYEFYEGLQEGWDGPALLVFSDGKTVSRNNLMNC